MYAVSKYPEYIWIPVTGISDMPENLKVNTYHNRQLSLIKLCWQLILYNCFRLHDQGWGKSIQGMHRCYSPAEQEGLHLQPSVLGHQFTHLHLKRRIKYLEVVVEQCQEAAAGRCWPRLEGHLEVDWSNLQKPPLLQLEEVGGLQETITKNKYTMVMEIPNTQARAAGTSSFREEKQSVCPCGRTDEHPSFLSTRNQLCFLTSHNTQQIMKTWTKPWTVCVASILELSNFNSPITWQPSSQQEFASRQSSLPIPDWSAANLLSVTALGSPVPLLSWADIACRGLTPTLPMEAGQLQRWKLLPYLREVLELAPALSQIL